MDTLPGTFTITTTIPTTITSSLHYRFRILAAIPYITSADNGSDISIGVRPTTLQFMNGYGYESIGQSISFEARIEGGNKFDTLIWDFGADASPATYKEIYLNDFMSRSAIYSTPGEKKVTLTVIAPGGCSRTITSTVDIFDCSSPRIPKYTKVVDSSQTILSNGLVLWVNPGVTLTLTGYYDTIFAEPGSTVLSAKSSLLYVKHGSVNSQTGGGNVIIYADGASVVNTNKPDFLLDCPTLDFDYSTAPPNSAHPVDGVAKSSLPSIIVSPNPTSGSITIHGLSLNDANVSVMNVLGESLTEFKNIRTSDLKVDLSKFTSGTYYVRCATANSVVTKMVVRE